MLNTNSIRTLLAADREAAREALVFTLCWYIANRQQGLWIDLASHAAEHPGFLDRQHWRDGHSQSAIAADGCGEVGFQAGHNVSPLDGVCIAGSGPPLGFDQS
jgi:hypothetical protein